MLRRFIIQVATLATAFALLAAPALAKARKLKCPKPNPSKTWGPDADWGGCSYAQLLAICDSTTYGGSDHHQCTSDDQNQDASELWQLLLHHKFNYQGCSAAAHQAACGKCMQDMVACNDDMKMHTRKNWNGNPAYCVHTYTNCIQAVVNGTKPEVLTPPDPSKTFCAGGALRNDDGTCPGEPQHAPAASEPSQPPPPSHCTGGGPCASPARR